MKDTIKETVKEESKSFLVEVTSSIVQGLIIKGVLVVGFMVGGYFAYDYIMNDIKEKTVAAINESKDQVKQEAIEKYTTVKAGIATKVVETKEKAKTFIAEHKNDINVTNSIQNGKEKVSLMTTAMIQKVKDIKKDEADSIDKKEVVSETEKSVQNEDVNKTTTKDKIEKAKETISNKWHGFKDRFTKKRRRMNHDI